MEHSNLIPEHKQGKQNDLFRSVTARNAQEAHDIFLKACNRIAMPWLWQDLAGPASAKFTLHDSAGEEVNRNVEVDDYLRIDIPGPGSPAGGGYDWVKMTAVDHTQDVATDEETFAVIVQPCDNPLSVDGTTAHFFKNIASSTFMIKRTGNTITSSYHGRNELPNNDTEHVADNIRNTVIATGAVLGLSEAQWSALISSFLNP